MLNRRATLCPAMAAGLALFILGQAGKCPAQDEPRDQVQRDVAQQDDGAETRQRPEDTLREMGQIEAASFVELRSAIESPTAILKIVPEGTVVMKGDFVVELESADLREQLAQQQIRVATRQAKLAQAEAQLDNLRRQADATTAAELRLKIAELAKNLYTAEGGQFELEIKALDREIELANKRLQVVEQRLERLTRLQRENVVEASEVEEVQLEAAEARGAIELATAKKKLHETYVRPFKLAELELAILDAKAALERTKQAQAAEIEASKAALEDSRIGLKVDLDNLKSIEAQIKACTIVAPQKGTVLYANVHSARSGAAFIVEEGAVVRERQTIVRVADTSRLQVGTSVKQEDVERLKVGQSATIQVDAFPDRVFRGRVSSIGERAEHLGFFRLGGAGNTYRVVIALDGPAKELRLGLSALVEIDVSKADED